MIKFCGTTKSGRTMIGLGLTEMNLAKLKTGLPIHIHADELGFRGEILIMYGKTEDSMAAEIREHLRVGKITDRRKDKRN